MAEYINREATIKAIHDVYEYGFPTASGAFDDFATKIVPSLLNSIPAADVAPVVHGRWIYKHRHRGGFRTYEVCDELGEKHSVRVDERYETDEPYCPECGKWNESVWLNYCPNCGVKMDGGADNG